MRGCHSDEIKEASGQVGEGDCAEEGCRRKDTFAHEPGKDTSEESGDVFPCDRARRSLSCRVGMLSVPFTRLPNTRTSSWPPDL